MRKIYNNDYIFEDHMNPNLHPFVGLTARANRYLPSGDHKIPGTTYQVHGTIAAYGTGAIMLLDNGELTAVHDVKFDNPTRAIEALHKFRS